MEERNQQRNEPVEVGNDVSNRSTDKRRRKRKLYLKLVFVFGFGLASGFFTKPGIGHLVLCLFFFANEFLTAFLLLDELEKP